MRDQAWTRSGVTAFGAIVLAVGASACLDAQPQWPAASAAPAATQVVGPRAPGVADALDATLAGRADFAELTRLYEPGRGRYLWLGAGGRPAELDAEHGGPFRLLRLWSAGLQHRFPFH